MTGHLLGAAGGLEAGITALAVHHQMRAADDQPRSLPTTAAISTTCRNVSGPMPIRYALSNSFGFGGTNGALLFKKFEAVR